MKTEASKKWVVSQYMDTDEWGIIDEDNHIIVGISSRITKETGEKIVRAVNAYAAMVEALEKDAICSDCLRESKQGYGGCDLRSCGHARLTLGYFVAETNDVFAKSALALAKEVKC